MIGQLVKQLRIACVLLLLFTVLTGFIYPMVVTGIAQLFFPWRANGSLIAQNGKIVGSQLLGQSFSDPRYFWSRPSATTPFPYNAENSSGSNLAASNPDFLAGVKNRVLHLQQSDPSNALPIPIDLVMASASGLDPDISLAAAIYQVHRVAKARGIDEKKISDLIDKVAMGRTLAILGEPRVNVLQLNIDLDTLSSGV